MHTLEGKGNIYKVSGKELRIFFKGTGVFKDTRVSKDTRVVLFRGIFMTGSSLK